MLRATSSNSDDEIISLIRERQPVVFVDAQGVFPSHLVRLAEIHNRVADLYGPAISVGPGLAPYRQLVAKVHILSPAKKR